MGSGRGIQNALTVSTAVLFLLKKYDKMLIFYIEWGTQVFSIIFHDFLYIWNIHDCKNWETIKFPHSKICGIQRNPEENLQPLKENRK